MICRHCKFKMSGPGDRFERELRHEREDCIYRDLDGKMLKDHPPHVKERVVRSRERMHGKTVRMTQPLESRERDEPRDDWESHYE